MADEKSEQRLDDQPPAPSRDLGPAGTEVAPETKQRRVRRPILAVLVLAVLLVIGYLLHNQRRSVAEAEARDALRQMGALLVLDASQTHVQGVDLRLPAVRQQLGQAIELLPKLPYVEVLRFSGTAITDDQLRHVGHRRRLTSLGLNDTAIGNAGLDYLTSLVDLRALYLAGTNISSEGLERIGRLTSLEILNLSETKIQGDLAGLAPLGNLQHILLSGVDLSEAALARSAGCHA